MTRLHSAAIGSLVAWFAAVLAGCADVPGPRHEAYAAIVHEEDARGARGLDRIREALESADPVVRANALRALGRMEDPELMAEIAARAQDAEARVRAAAALAIGQAAFGRPGTEATAHLRGLVSNGDPPSVLGSVATAAGWITPNDPEELAQLTELLAEVDRALPTADGDPGLVGRLGLARGVEALARRNRFAGPESFELEGLASGLTETRSRDDHPGESLAAARIRGLATSALAAGDRLSADALERAVQDAHFEVRRQAALAVTRYGTQYRAHVPLLLADVDPRVRLTALGAYDRWLRPSQGCGPILERLEDADPHVALGAVDLLASPCSDLAVQRDALSALATAPDTRGAGGSAGTEDGSWHLQARALWALASVAPEAARERLGGMSAHPSPFARAWAARAAAQAGALESLESLARDSDPNVRTAAITGLDRLAGTSSATTYRIQLDADDPLLVMTAVGLLPAGELSDPTVLPDVLRALERFTDMRRETSRDVRMALLEFAGTSPSMTREVIEPYLTDFDPAVAEAAAALLEAAGGPTQNAAPVPLESTPAPTPARLAQLERSAVVLEMASGGRIVVALRPDLAATNADRFARLAEDGYFDDLTFHRVVPNFVIQGGSPGANEFFGAGAYSRDEISHESHWRGTVGLSTRGRDTGDAQIFINLVDNPRLDFNYTIYGEVTEGMNVADRLLEGAVIRRARLTRAGRP